MTLVPRAVCVTCGRLMPWAELNHEGLIHHRARKLECIDRKSCERAKRKRK